MSKNLTKIKMVPSDSTGLNANGKYVPNSSVDTDISISEIFDFVKNRDKDFEKNSKTPVYFTPESPFDYIMLGVTRMDDDKGRSGYYAVRLVVKDRKKDGAILQEANVLGRIKAINAKKSPSQTIGTVLQELLPSSRADDLNIV